MSDSESDVSVESVVARRGYLSLSPHPRPGGLRPGSPVPAVEFTKFMIITPEIRLNIYKCIAPTNCCLILDPDNITYPSPFAQHNYGDTFAMLQTSKQVHTEMIPLLYSRNTITLVRPTEIAHYALGITSLIGEIAVSNIRSLEFGMSNGLEELGYLWEEISAIQHLSKLRLVFYHNNGMKWIRQLGELASAMVYNTPTMGKLARPAEFVLQAELYQSIAIGQHSAATYTQKLENYMGKAKAKGRVYSLTLPRRLQMVTITGSVSQHAAFAFATYRHEGWRFNAPKGPSKDNNIRKCLVWERETQGVEAAGDGSKA